MVRKLYLILFIIDHDYTNNICLYHINRGGCIKDTGSLRKINNPTKQNKSMLPQIFLSTSNHYL